MKKYKYSSYEIADIGDYLKVFACTAVMSQPIMSIINNMHQSQQTQVGFGILYNLVKYTAPAFIFGILYTTIRNSDLNGHFSYFKHLQKNWSNLFVPTIWWTLIYLLGMPWLQQGNKFNSFGTFAGNLLMVMQHLTYGITR